MTTPCCCSAGHLQRCAALQLSTHLNSSKLAYNTYQGAQPRMAACSSIFEITTAAERSQQNHPSRRNAFCRPSDAARPADGTSTGDDLEDSTLHPNRCPRISCTKSETAWLRPMCLHLAGQMQTDKNMRMASSSKAASNAECSEGFPRTNLWAFLRFLIAVSVGARFLGTILVQPSTNPRGPLSAVNVTHILFDRDIECDLAPDACLFSSTSSRQCDLSCNSAGSFEARREHSGLLQLPVKSIHARVPRPQQFLP